MNWKMLDIRMGRVNRIQFTLGVPMLVAPFWGISSSDLPIILKITFAIPFLYLLLMLFMRRIRDIGGNSSFVSVLYALIPTTTVATGYAFREKHLIACVIIVAVAFILYLNLTRGDLRSNKHGFPPDSLNFLSMVSTGGYTAKQEEAIRKDDVLQEEKLRLQKIREMERQDRTLSKKTNDQLEHSHEMQEVPVRGKTE